MEINLTKFNLSFNCHSIVSNLSYEYSNCLPESRRLLRVFQEYNPSLLFPRGFSSVQYQSRPKSSCFHKQTCFFWKSGLFNVDPNEVNNPKRDNYLNNLASLQRVQFPLYQTRPKSSCFCKQTIHSNTLQMKCFFRMSGLFAIDPYKATNPVVNNYLNDLVTRFLRFGLFFIDSSEANNPKNDHYLNNLTFLLRVPFPLCLRRSRLFVIDSSEVKNPKGDNYLNNLASFQRVQFPLYQTRPKSSCFQQTICYTFQMKSSCCFWKSGLFFINPSKDNNPISDNYLNSLASYHFWTRDTITVNSSHIYLSINSYPI